MRTHCRKGHRLTKANTLVQSDGGGRTRVRCKRCRRDNDKQRWATGAKRKSTPTTMLDPLDPRHGTSSGYTYWRCRCEKCSACVARKSAAVRRRERIRRELEKIITDPNFDPEPTWRWLQAQRRRPTVVSIVDERDRRSDDQWDPTGEAATG